MLQSSLRLKLVEHFDSIICKIDIFTEKKIEKEEASEASQEFWNSRRDEQIRVIREIEQSCLDFVNRNPQIQDEEESIYVENCCTFEHRGLLFLLKSKRRVQSDELSMLQTRLKWPHLSYDKQMKHLIPNKPYSYDKIRVKFTHDIDSMLTRNSSVIDIEPWLNESKHLDELTYRSNNEDKCSLKFLDEIGYIKEFIIYLNKDRFIDKDADKLQEWSKAVQNLANKPSQIGKIILHLQVSYQTSDLNATLSLFPQHERLERKLLFSYRTATEKESLESNPFGKLESAVNQLTNWQVLRNVVLDIQPEHVRMLNFSNLNSVDHLELIIGYGRSDQRIYTVSSKIFDSMSSLKKLTFTDTNFKPAIKLVDQSRMFAGLKCLEKLSISNDLLRSSCFINLPTLTHLSLDYNRNGSGTTYWSSFYCPNLISLQLDDVGCSKSLSSGFSRFPKLEKLKLSFFSQETLDQSVLNSLDNLTDLEISFDHTKMRAKALSKLASLRSVLFKFPYSYPAFKPKDHKFYDGLYRLERIMIELPGDCSSRWDYSTEYPDTRQTEEYVFMKNLNRHVLFIDSTIVTENEF